MGRSSGKIIMTGNKLGKAYGDLRLFSGLDMEIVRGEKIALVGKNGVGKSTLVRMIVNKETHEGEMKPGYSVQLGYYAQNQADSLDMEKTVFQTSDDEAVGDLSLVGAPSTEIGVSASDKLEFHRYRSIEKCCQQAFLGKRDTQYQYLSCDTRKVDESVAICR